MKRILFLVPALVLAAFQGHASAQSTAIAKYRADVLPNGEIQLVPIGSNGTGIGSRSPAQQTASEAAPAMFLVKDASGAVKGVFTSQAAALAKPLEPGDKIEVLPLKSGAQASGETGAVSDELLRRVALEAGRKLMTAAKDTACTFEPLPESITPSVEVSFGFLAGGKLSIAATWQTEKICPKKQ